MIWGYPVMTKRKRLFRDDFSPNFPTHQSQGPQVLLPSSRKAVTAMAPGRMVGLYLNDRSLELRGEIRSLFLQAQMRSMVLEDVSKKTGPFLRGKSIGKYIPAPWFAFKGTGDLASSRNAGSRRKKHLRSISGKNPMKLPSFDDSDDD